MSSISYRSLGDVKREAVRQDDSETPPPRKKSNKPQAFEAKIGEECGVASSCCLLSP